MNIIPIVGQTTKKLERSRIWDIIVPIATPPKLEAINWDVAFVVISAILSFEKFTNIGIRVAPDTSIETFLQIFAIDAIIKKYVGLRRVII